MKKILTISLITIIIVSSILYVGYKNEDKIYKYYQDKILRVKDNIKITNNEYYKSKNYSYMQNTNKFVATSKDELKNIFYTIVNSGNESFTFYCDDNYKSCNDDIIAFVKNKEVLSSINNFVHPYNSFKDLTASYDKFGKVTVKVNHLYSNEDIEYVNKFIEDFKKKNINDKMDNKKKIKAFHDYVIKYSRYATDSYREKNKSTSFNKASDIIKTKYGLCSAYADIFSIYLNNLGIDNYKIVSESHIWNLVNLDNKWYHVDLTWDDPVTTNGKDKLEYLFFMIDNKKLRDLKVSKHNYNKEIFKEAA